MHYCECYTAEYAEKLFRWMFSDDVEAEGTDQPEPEYCGRPASIKANGHWMCAQCYDYLEVETYTDEFGYEEIDDMEQS